MAAFVIFKQQQCDVWVLEVGLGGRLDVVNVIDPDVAVITNIGIDHTDWLGDTIEKLLLKSRYYPPSYSCHFAGEQSLPQAIQDKANSSQATLYAINRDYFYKLVDDGKHWYFASEGTTLRLPLGTLAIENIAGAVGTY